MSLKFWKPGTVGPGSTLDRATEVEGNVVPSAPVYSHREYLPIFKHRAPQFLCNYDAIQRPSTQETSCCVVSKALVSLSSLARLAAVKPLVSSVFPFTRQSVYSSKHQNFPNTSLKPAGLPKVASSPAHNLDVSLLLLLLHGLLPKLERLLETRFMSTHYNNMTAKTC